MSISDAIAIAAVAVSAVGVLVTLAIAARRSAMLRAAADARIDARLAEVAKNAVTQSDLERRISACAPAAEFRDTILELRASIDQPALLDQLRDRFDHAISELHEKVNTIYRELGRTDYVDREELLGKITRVNTELQVLAEGVGSLLDGHHNVEKSVARLLSKGGQEAEKIRHLEDFQGKCESSLRDIRDRLARIEARQVPQPRYAQA